MGGTELTKNPNSRGWAESAWPDTGGGCGKEAKPTWQTASPDCAYRTNNDVAADASLSTPVSTYINYSRNRTGWALGAGTSASTPIIAGAMALANSYTKSFPGAEGLYLQALQNGTGVLDNVRYGSNTKAGEENCGTYLCNAIEGYDGPTGLGSPWGAPVVSTITPTVTTESATNLVDHSGTLNGTLNPNGPETEYYFEYGPTIGYGYSTSRGIVGFGTSSSPVSEKVASGLKGDTTYHFRLVAVANAVGATPTYGEDHTFVTPGSEPAVTLEAATGVTSTSATVSGTVNPDNVATEYRFECVPVAHQEANECGAPQESAGERDSAVKVSYTYTNLTPETTYDYWLKGTNALGTVYTAEGSFNTPPVGAPPAVKYVSSFGAEGTGEGQFNEPSGVARDSKGDLWVVDTGNERVQEFNEEGKFMLMFGKEVNKTKVEAKGTEAEEDLCTAASGNVCQAGKEGSGSSQFKSPRGIAIDVHNDVWVADNGNGRVKEFNEKGEFVRDSEVSVEKAAGVGVGPQGDVWATEGMFDSRVLEFNGEGEQLVAFGSFWSECNGEYEFFDPAGITVANGHVWMDDVYCDRIDEFNEEGQYVERFGREGSGYGELDEPSGVAVNRAGTRVGAGLRERPGGGVHGTW